MFIENEITINDGQFGFKEYIGNWEAVSYFAKLV